MHSTGACLLYKFARVVIGENKTFVGGEEYLKQRGVEVVVLGNQECEDLMTQVGFVEPRLWPCMLMMMSSSSSKSQKSGT